MRNYTIFHPYLFSFFSPGLYRDIAQNWRGLNFLYLLLLLALCWLVTMFQVHQQAQAFNATEAPKIIEQVPNIKIENGKLSIDRPSPYRITSAEDDKTVVIFDMDGQFESPDDANAYVLVTPDRVMVRRNEFETRTFELAQFDGLSLDQTMVQQWAQTASRWFAPVAYPFAVLGSFIYRMIQVLIYGVIGLLFSAITGAKLSYAALVRLAVTAITPVLLLDTLVTSLNITIPFWGGLCFLIAMVYLLFGVIANRRANSAPTGLYELR